jgi:uncharacterized protein YbaR (Trm112 family)
MTAKAYIELNPQETEETLELKKTLLDILACPICKSHPLELHIFEEKEEIVSGLLVCTSCNRYYPVIDEIPHMLPDELRNHDEDLGFLKVWESKVPKKILDEGKPFNFRK